MRRLVPIDIPPGMDKRSTALLSEGRWVDGDKVRSVGGIIETIGGWTKFSGLLTLIGKCRGITTWRALDQTKAAAFGTHIRLYQWGGGTLTNITPIRDSGTLGLDPFTTTSGSSVVTVAHTAHGVADKTFVNYTGAAAVGGLTVDGDYQATLIDANTLEITDDETASSSATGGGGSVAYSYEINAGEESSIDTFGYGVGPYGQETYGTPRTLASFLLNARTWSLDPRGEDLIACHRAGDIFLWDFSVGGRAALLTNAPLNNVMAFVAAERHIIAIGPAGNRMRVGWSDIDDPTIWAAAAANQAGDFDLIGGSELVGGWRLKKALILLWSDTDCFRMRYIGQDPWWTFKTEGSGSGLVGPHAFQELAGIAYWMGEEVFYTYDGSVYEMPNQDLIKNYIFEDATDGVDKMQYDKVFSFRYVPNREIWWLYQSVSGTDCDRYVMFNIDEASWYVGTMAFTARHEAVIFSNPIAVLDTGVVYDMESGQDADGLALLKTITSGSYDIGEGEQNMTIFALLPDFENVSGNLELRFLMRSQAQSTPRTEGPFTFTGTDDIVDTDADGKMAQVQLDSNELGGKFRLGRARLEVKPSGKRRG